MLGQILVKRREKNQIRSLSPANAWTIRHEDPETFNFLRVPPDMFHDLLVGLGPICNKQDTHYRNTEWILLYVTFCTWQYRDRRKSEAGIMPYCYLEWFQGFFIVYSTTGSTVHSMPLNSLEHCICTTTMTNIWPDRDSNLVSPVYKP